MDGGAFDYNKLYQKPHDAAYYATYVPHYKSFNGITPGFITEVSEDRSKHHTKTFNFDPLDGGIYAGVINNSYGNLMGIAGVRYTPFIAKIKTEALGGFTVRAGVTAGMAYNGHGDYRRDAPSVGNASLIGYGVLMAEHDESGLGAIVTGLPPIGERYGLVTIGVSKKFDKVFGF